NLILAEYAKFKKEYWDASQYYDTALESAIENEYNLDAGLCAELAGEFYLEQNRNQQAKKYLQTSLYYYDLCGAKAKINHVRSLYPEYISEDITKNDSGITSRSHHSTVERTQSHSLDIQTILKANQVLSSEINLDNLLKKLLSITLENAGATRGVLLLYEGENLFIEAEGKIENNQVTIFKDLSVKSYTEIPQSLIQYAVRTSKTILLDSAIEDSQFSENPYIQRENILSLICMPIVTKGKSIGYMYLENNLIRGAFTKERIETLNLITAQAAISIENAKLYDSMEEKVRERTLSLENAIEVLQKTKTELETEKSQMERIQFMSQEIQKKTNFQEILYSLEEIIWNTYKISDYILAIKDLELGQYRAFSLCKHWEKNDLNKNLKNVSIDEEDSIYHLVFTKHRSIYLKRFRDIYTGETEEYNRNLLGTESLFLIPCIIN
ncbi:MAG: GAF domain-containing protein, partial [Spirochaetia bacterium]|nr:GAF domain-containing protein [Spirochaetia bacterium]